MIKFELENNERFYNRCVEEGKYPQDVMEAVIEELDLKGFEVVVMGNGSFIDVYDTTNNTFLGITTKRDVIDYAIELKEDWIDAMEDSDIEEETLEYHKNRLSIIKRGMKR